MCLIPLKYHPPSKISLLDNTLHLYNHLPMLLRTYYNPLSSNSKNIIYLNLLTYYKYWVFYLLPKYYEKLGDCLPLYVHDDTYIYAYTDNRLVRLYPEILWRIKSMSVKNTKDPRQKCLDDLTHYIQWARMDDGIFS